LAHLVQMFHKHDKLVIMLLDRREDVHQIRILVIEQKSRCGIHGMKEQGHRATATKVIDTVLGMQPLKEWIIAVEHLGFGTCVPEQWMNLDSFLLVACCSAS